MDKEKPKNLILEPPEDIVKRNEAIDKARAVLRRNGYTVRAVDLDKILRRVKR